MIYNIYFTTYVDLDSSTAEGSAHTAEEQLLGQAPSVTDLAVDQDDDENEEEPVEEPSAADIVEAGVTRGQLDQDTVQMDQRAVDNAEEQLIQQFSIHV